MSDFPAPPVPVNHVQPVPRRIRAFLAGEVVVDTTNARYVWENTSYPQYYIPLADVAPRARRRGHAPWRRHGATPGASACASVTSTGPGGHRAHRGQGGGARRHRPLLVVGLRRLVRGGRAGLRPPAQSLHARRLAAVEPAPARGVQGRGAGRDVVARPVLRDRAPDPVLHRPHRRGLHPSGAVGHADGMPVQGDDERLLVGRRRAAHPSRHRLDL